ncbi:FAD binding domain-containing protein [Halobacterium wangiae]|uniref:FAD binding domain-containing protein n=1 Tax=Halobacterium wangiae TaxID=2902623 RepID=UPI001E552878|nr:xanthine dehydrogenase family protein subunit M [Halobacterium wangiae]
MYPDSFDYYRPDSVEEALELLDEHAMDNPAVLSGGHSLVPTIKSGLASPGVIVDIGEIDDITGVEENGDHVHVGACTRYSDVVGDAIVEEHVPGLAEATGEIGDTQVRNRGTVGGNIAHADPASDLPAVVVATDATIHAQGPDGSRELAADDFFLSVYMTSLGPDEILTGIDFPKLDDGVAAYEKKPSPSSGYAMVGVAVRLEFDGDTVSKAGIAANGALDRAVRLEGAEQELEGSEPTPAVVSAAAEAATDGIDTDEMMDDIQADGAYRAQLLESYTGRALEKAVDRR